MIRLSEGIARANCVPDITPAFVREAYSLLRQSIIHVEKDDINLDEEDEDGPGGAGLRPPAEEGTSQLEGDMEVDGETQGITSVTSPSHAGTSYPGVPTSPGSPSRAGMSHVPPLQLGTPQQPRQPQKRKLKITHDKYMTMQSLIVLHLSEQERSTGKGEEREALIDWYLEKKEEEGGITNLEELEYEKELVGKVIQKLVKVSPDIPRAFIININDRLSNQQDNYLIGVNEDVLESLPSESQDADGTATSTTGGTSLGAGQKRVVYMVHPSVDADSSSYA